MMRLITWPFRFLIFLVQSVLLALVQIWNNKARSMLTMLGIIIAVASVIAVIGVLDSLQRKVLAQFETFGSRKLSVYAEQPRLPTGYGTYRSFDEDDFDQVLDACPSIRYSSRVAWWNGPARYGAYKSPESEIQGVDPDYFSIEQRKMVLGRPLSILDSARRVCVVDRYTLEKLRMPADPVGRTIYLHNTPFVIVGVVEEKTGLFGTRERKVEALVPFERIPRQRRGYFSLTAEAKSALHTEEAKAELEWHMRQVRRLTPLDPPDFHVSMPQEMVENFRKTTTSLTMGVAGVVSISLLVGGIGIMNIMLVSVSERTREIGLRKAVGARPSAILLQFLVEAVTLCLVGGAVGLLTGFGLAKSIAKLPAIDLPDLAIPWWAMVMSVSFSAATGLIFGLLPAIKAARLDPIVALRHT